MQRTVAITEPVPGHPSYLNPVHGLNQSAVSWAAIIAGAVIAAALTVTLLIGGTGLGFLAASPWQNEGASGETIAIGTIVWLFVTQVIAYGIAGYVAGRLRTKWADTHVDEIYFRDTAHGFLVWALSSIVGIVLLSSATASIVSGTAKVGASAAGATVGAVGAAAAPALQDSDTFSLDYFTDTLLRPQDPQLRYEQSSPRDEVTTILSRGMMQGQLSAEDQDYLVKVVADRAGVSEDEAKTRILQVTERAQKAVDELELKAKEAADTTRKAAATFALWSFVSLLLGAFVASFAATIGGRTRDKV